MRLFNLGLSITLFSHAFAQTITLNQGRTEVLVIGGPEPKF